MSAGRPRPEARPWGFLLVALALLAVDQVVKAWARGVTGGVEGRSIHPLWPGVFELKLVYNEGVAFGLFQGAGVFLAPVAILIAGAATWYSFRHPHQATVNHVTAALLASGAVGNLIDRLWMGRVTDMFWIRAINFPVFNIADVCITAAGTLLVLHGIRDAFAKKPAQEPGLSE